MVLLLSACDTSVKCTNYINFLSRKEQTVLMSAKYNRKCAKDINLLPCRKFFMTLINIFFLLKMKKIGKFGLNYPRQMIYPLVLRILSRSDKKYQYEKKNSEEGCFPLPGE